MFSQQFWFTLHWPQARPGGPESERFQRGAAEGVYLPQYRPVQDAGPGRRHRGPEVSRQGSPLHHLPGALIGGVWKTTNNGTTWEPIFDGQSNGSIGDIALSPSHPNTVWGDRRCLCVAQLACGRRHLQSTDGGKTWKNMGLADSHHIARIVVHPTDPTSSCRCSGTSD